MPVKKIRLWIAQCQQRKKEIFRYLLDNFDVNDQRIELFSGVNYQDVLHPRGGYWAGFQLIKKIAELKKYSVVDLLKLSKNSFKKRIKDQLKTEVVE